MVWLLFPKVPPRRKDATKRLMNPVSEFADKAKALTRNPLGMIGLFIVLVYAIALAITVAPNVLSANQRWASLAFIFLFAFYVMHSFLDLVKNHPRKLYAPRDFRNDDTFLRYAGPELKTDKEAEEARELMSGEPLDPSGGPDGETPSQPWSQDIEKGRQVVRQSETLAIGLLEREFNRKIDRDIAFPDGRALFDGAIVGPDAIVAIEVRALKYAGQARLAVDAVLRSLVNANRHLQSLSSPVPLHGLIVFVTIDASISEERTQHVIDAALATWETRIPVEVRIYSLEELQAQAGRILGPDAINR